MKRIMAMVFVGVFLFTGVAFSTPVQWESSAGGNDHWYELISYTATWDQAAMMQSKDTGRDYKGIWPR